MAAKWKLEKELRLCVLLALQVSYAWQIITHNPAVALFKPAKIATAHLSSYNSGMDEAF